MLNKKRVIFFVVGILLLIGGVFILNGCSDSGNSASNSTSDAITSNGIRLDVEQYINNTYPDSAKKRAALMGYAKTLQTAYTEVNTQAEATIMEPKIIRALSCTNFVIGEYKGSNDPTNKIDNMMMNTPERLAAQLKYEKLLDGKVFTISSPDDTIETVCDFNSNSLPN